MKSLPKLEVTSFFTVDKRQERCMVQLSRKISELIINAKPEIETFRDGHSSYYMLTVASASTSQHQLNTSMSEYVIK